MSVPVTKTRVDIDAGHVVVEVEIYGAEPMRLDDERAAQLRARLAEAVEGVFDSFWQAG